MSLKQVRMILDKLDKRYAMEYVVLKIVTSEGRPNCGR